MKRARVTGRNIINEIGEWGMVLKKEGIVSNRIKNLNKPLSAYDGKELLAHALWLMGCVRDALMNGAKVHEVHGDFCVARTILSFCARIPCGELSPFE